MRARPQITKGHGELRVLGQVTSEPTSAPMPIAKDMRPAKPSTLEPNASKFDGCLPVAVIHASLIAINSGGSLRRAATATMPGSATRRVS